jgi:hypothetical protein
MRGAFSRPRNEGSIFTQKPGCRTLLLLADGPLRHVRVLRASVRKLALFVEIHAAYNCAQQAPSKRNLSGVPNGHERLTKQPLTQEQHTSAKRFLRVSHPEFLRNFYVDLTREIPSRGADTPY